MTIIRGIKAPRFSVGTAPVSRAGNLDQLFFFILESFRENVVCNGTSIGMKKIIEITNRNFQEWLIQNAE